MTVIFSKRTKYLKLTLQSSKAYRNLTHNVDAFSLSVWGQGHTAPCLLDPLVHIVTSLSRRGRAGSRWALPRIF